MNRLRSLFSRMGNPLDWDPVDKAVLFVFINVPMLLSWELWRQFMLATSWREQVNAEMLSHYGSLFQSAIALTFALGLLGVLVRRHPLAIRFFPYVAIQFYALSLCLFGYLIGSFSMATGLVMAGGPIVGFILFPRRVVYPALVVSALVILACTYAAVIGKIPYAPLFMTDVMQDPIAAQVWFYSMLYFALPQLVVIVALGDAVVTRWRRREKEVHELSLTDALTGVRNRRSITDFLAQEVARSRRNAQPLALVMVDLDHFKPINDVYGHQTGDRALKLAARVLADAIRSTDAIGRYGGEEFMLVLPEADTEGARILAERCRQRLAEIVVPASTGEQIGLTASFGVFCNEKDPGLDADTLMRLADNALYEAKAAGRNRVSVWRGQSKQDGETVAD